MYNDNIITYYIVRNAPRRFDFDLLRSWTE